jgi:hypothetical protein
MRTRFVMGAILLAGCLAWMHQNGIMDEEAMRRGRELLDQYDLADMRSGRLPPLIVIPETTRPLRLPAVPEQFTRWFNSFQPAAAAAILILSAFIPGLRISFFVIPAALIIVAGQHLGIPPIAVLGGHHGTNLALGVALAVLGFFLSQEG